MYNDNDSYFLFDLKSPYVFSDVLASKKVIEISKSYVSSLKEYDDFYSSIKEKRKMSFSTEALKKNHISILNAECFSKMSQLTNKYLQYTNTLLYEVQNSLSYLNSARINLETVYNLKQVRSISDSKYSDIKFNNIEHALDVSKRIETFRDIFLILRDVKSIASDPVRKENLLGNTLTYVFQKLNSLRSCKHVYDKLEKENTYKLAHATPVYLSNVSLKQAGYSNSVMFSIYQSICKLSELIINKFNDTYIDISAYSKNTTYFNSVIKSIKSTNYDKDNIPQEESILVRFYRESKALDIITNTILPSLYSDILTFIDVFSSFDDTHNKEVFKKSKVSKDMDDLYNTIEFDNKLINTNKSKYINIVKDRAITRLNSLQNSIEYNTEFSVEEKEVLPIRLDHLHSRLQTFVFLFSNLESISHRFIDNTPAIANITDEEDDEKISKELDDMNDEYIKMLDMDVKFGVENNLIHVSLEYLDMLEKLPKIESSKLGYDSSGITNDLIKNDVIELKYSINKLYTSLKGVTSGWECMSYIPKTDISSKKKMEEKADKNIYVLSKYFALISALALVCKDIDVEVINNIS